MNSSNSNNNSKRPLKDYNNKDHAEVADRRVDTGISSSSNNNCNRNGNANKRSKQSRENDNVEKVQMHHHQQNNGRKVGNIDDDDDRGTEARKLDCIQNLSRSSSRQNSNSISDRHQDKSSKVLL